MRRYGLRDDQWDWIKGLLPGREGSVGATAADNRLFVEAVLYRYRAGIPWRDLPERFGDWKNTHRRFSRWTKSGVWKRVFEHLAAGGLSTKIHTMVDAPGNPIGFHPPAARLTTWLAQITCCRTCNPILLIADKAFDADERVIEPLAAAGKTAIIPPKANRRSPRKFDRHLYEARHLVENFFAALKQFRAIATRYDKTARNFLTAVYLTACAIWLN